MRCLTKIESEDWVNGHGFAVNPIIPSSKIFCISGDIPKDFNRLTAFGNFLATSFISFETCLLWITGWGIWPSSENPHLFYRLRQTYFENRLLAEAPGHLFLKHEVPDLASFISVGVVCGWDFQLRPSPCWIHGFVSHDEWFNLKADVEANLDSVKKALEQMKITYKLSSESI